MIKKTGQHYTGTILVVDDEQDLRDILRADLEDGGHVILEAASGNAAFEVIQQENIDLVVSDVRMPDGSGFDLLRMIQTMKSSAPQVLLVSGHEISEAEVRDLGAHGLLSKPWDGVELFYKIQSLLAKQLTGSKRRSERFRIDWPTDFSLHGGDLERQGRACNLGQGGMYIGEPSYLPKIDQRIYFSVQAPSGKDISGIGVVRWVRSRVSDPAESGFGVEFLELHENKQENFAILLDDLRQSGECD